MPMVALLDGGADVSAVRSDYLNKFQQPIANPQIGRPLRDIQSKPMASTAQFEATIKGPGGLDTKFPVQAVPDLESECVLGWDFHQWIGADTDADKNTVTFKYPKGKIMGSLTNQSSPEPTTMKASTMSLETLRANDTAWIDVKVKPPHPSMQLRPGAELLVLSDPGQYSIIDCIVKVKNNNVITIPISNNTCRDIFLPRNTDLEGAVVEFINVREVPTKLSEVIAGMTQSRGSKIDSITKEKRQYLMENADLQQVPEIWKKSYMNFILYNHDIFSHGEYDVGHSKTVSHKVTFKDNNPVFTAQFRIPHHHEKTLKTHIKEWAKCGIVYKTMSPYNSPIFMVPKDSGGFRIVQDFRNINDKSLDDKYSIKDTRECINILGRTDSDTYTKWDLSHAFWQMDLDPSSRQASAFTLPFDNTQWAWTRTCMGMKGATSSFSRLMGIVMQDMPGTITYVDDFLNFSNGHESHINLLYKIAAKLRQHNLKANILKCKWGCKYVEFLGFGICYGSITPAQDKIQAVREMNPPVTVAKIQQFLGLSNYFRSFIKSFSRITAPLCQLTRKNANFKPPLNPKAMAAFMEIKKQLCRQPIMALPNPSKPYTIASDACLGSPEEAGGVGAILTQSYPEGERVVSYYSRQLKDHEQNYTTMGVEKLAIVEALKHYHEYIWGHPFPTTVITDHEPLVPASRNQQKTLDRLTDLIQMYNVKIVYRSKKDNQAADCLSRNSLPVHSSQHSAVPVQSSSHPKPHVSLQHPLQQSPSPVHSLGPQVSSQHPSQQSPSPVHSSGHSSQPSQHPSQQSPSAVHSSGHPASQVQAHPIMAAMTMTEKLQQEQAEDPFIKGMKKFINNKILPQNQTLARLISMYSPRCYIKNEILFFMQARRGQEAKARMVVPAKMVKHVLELNHGNTLSGHWGIEKTMERILLDYWWPFLAADCAKFIENCQKCQEIKDGKNLKEKTLLRPYEQSPCFNYRVHADLWGPAKTTNGDKKYCLVLTCAHSKLVELVSIPNKTAECLANSIFNHWICTYGPMVVVVMDGGREFRNKVCDSIFHLMQIKKLTSSAFHPIAQGQVEVFNKSMRRYLQTFVNDETLDWEKYIFPLKYSHNTAIHASTLHSPYYITYNTTPRMPWRPLAPNENVNQTAGEIFTRMVKTQELVCKNNEEAREKYSKYYNKKATLKTLQIGDRCLIHFPQVPPGINQKLWRPWKGIYRVTKVNNMDTVEVMRLMDRKPYKVHVNRVRLFHEEKDRSDPSVEFVIGQSSQQVLEHPPPQAQVHAAHSHLQVSEHSPPHASAAPQHSSSSQDEEISLGEFHEVRRQQQRNNRSNNNLNGNRTGLHAQPIHENINVRMNNVQLDPINARQNYEDVNVSQNNVQLDPMNARQNYEDVNSSQGAGEISAAEGNAEAAGNISSPLNSTLSSDGHLNIREFLEAAELDNSLPTQIGHPGADNTHVLATNQGMSTGGSTTQDDLVSTVPILTGNSSNTPLQVSGPQHLPSPAAQPSQATTQPLSATQTVAQAIVPAILSPRQTRNRGVPQGHWRSNGWQPLPK